MRVAIPTNDGMNIVYHLRFASGFMIYEIEDNTIQNKYYKKLSEFNDQMIENYQAWYANVVKLLADYDILILYAMNKKIENNFKGSITQIFLTSAGDLQSCISQYLQGKLIKVGS